MHPLTTALFALLGGLLGWFWRSRGASSRSSRSAGMRLFVSLRTAFCCSYFVSILIAAVPFNKIAVLATGIGLAIAILRAATAPKPTKALVFCSDEEFNELYREHPTIVDATIFAGAKGARPGGEIDCIKSDGNIQTVKVHEFDQMNVVWGHIHGPMTTDEIEAYAKTQGVHCVRLYCPDGQGSNGGNEYKPGESGTSSIQVTTASAVPNNKGEEGTTATEPTNKSDIRNYLLPEEYGEYERLLSERFTVDDSRPQSPEQQQKTTRNEQRVAELFALAGNRGYVQP